MRDKNKPGYVKRYRKINLLWLLMWIVIGVAIVVTGRLIWHTGANILTVIGILAVLPGAKRLVALVVAGKKRSVELSRCERIQEALSEYKYAYDVDTWDYDTYETEAEDAEKDSEKTNEKETEDTDKNSEQIIEETTGKESDQTSLDVEPGEAVIFTDYIFTSQEKIMMLDFLVEKQGNIIALPAPGSDDIDYIKKYITDGVRKISDHHHILFVGSDDELARKLKGIVAVAIDDKTRREVLAYLKSLAV